jgi:hypothetical protein
MTISNVSEKNPKASTNHPLGWPVIGKLEDRLVVGRNAARQKKSRNRRLILNFGFFVRGCRIGKTNFSRSATHRAGQP